MKILLDYQGRTVRLTDERLAHILSHPEMATMTEALEETLRYPQRVVQSTSDTSAELSYRWYEGTIVGDKWLCIVVKYVVNDAFVVTAYFTDKIKQGAQLWPQP